MAANEPFAILVTPPSSSAAVDASSAWAPLRQPLFRGLWLAAIASNMGTWMQDVGAAWLMTSLAPSAVMVALVRTAMALPMFFFALPAGALADIVDRRRLLLFTQSLMLLAAATLAALTFAGLTTPLLLLALTFALGLGNALNAPAWQSTVVELVPRSQIAPAVALNSASINLARSVGPALAGLIIAATSPAATFALNAVSFAGVLFVLFRWPRKRQEAVLPGERVLGAVRTGLRYVRHSPMVLATLTRSSAFTVFASSLLALLPALARFELGRGPTGYGVLLGFFGAGAVAAATVLPRVRQRLSSEDVVAAAILIFAAALFALAWLRQVALVDLAVFLAGGMWLTLLSTFNASVQSAVPSWVRGRVVSVSILAFFGSMAAGSAFWGWIADRFGMSLALSAAGVGLLAGLLVTYRLRLSDAAQLDLTPSVHWPAPDVVKRAAPHQGPVVVTVDYEIEPKKLRHFRRVMKRVRRIRKRDGAINWGLLANVERPNHYTETFVVESWVEHLRQHERVTVADRTVLEKARSFHVGKEAPRVTHFIVEPVRG